MQATLRTGQVETVSAGMFHTCSAVASGPVFSNVALMLTLLRADALIGRKGHIRCQYAKTAANCKVNARTQSTIHVCRMALQFRHMDIVDILDIFDSLDVQCSRRERSVLLRLRNGFATGREEPRAGAATVQAQIVFML